ncbi:hypothetical protein CYMTET_43649 [Cymbomonas tetramitiformis]|uniref:Uncharacterized protein n=1 Tax=Cymbomonas tetramitiformis TaxID=36881 RepID=A0AAE0C316_9CHLO|nr:hypothetical protein CYMTET_43649 [Cymbomonas tetramitiformis]
MSDQPYTLIVTETGVSERKLGTCGTEADHCAGDLLTPSLTLVSSTVHDGIRTVVVTRPLLGVSTDYYTFDTVEHATINVIAAVGAGPAFAYHKARSALVLSLASVNAPTCVCDAGAIGQLCETGGVNCHKFVKNCLPAPDADLLAQHNPTCNSDTYGGGLSCCGHKRIMLDADQEVRPELLRYHMKFRFWFQEYRPAGGAAGAKPSHYNLPRIYQQTEANAGEYDVPPAFARDGVPIPGYPNWPKNKPTPGTTCTGACPDGPDCACVHTIHYRWKLGNTRLIYAGGHCHAPSCISLELFRNDTGELLCRQLPQYGRGSFPEDKWDEAGYAAIPPCLWGDDEGLQPSVFLPPNTPVLSIKRNHNTHSGHFGEMASWQMRGVNFPAEDQMILTEGKSATS